MWLLWEPEDVLLFRDSRPFAAGEAHRAEGSFPPLPHTTAGALRTALLSRGLAAAGADFAAYTGGADSTAALRADLGDARSMGRLQLRGPIVCRYRPGTDEAEPIFPLPADLVYGWPARPVEAESLGVRRGPAGLDGALALLEATRLDTAEEAKSDASGGWVTVTDLEGYLSGWASKMIPLPAPTLAEERTGVALHSDTRTARAGMLYTARLHRPNWTADKATGLLLEATLPDGHEPPTGCLPLGGEGRSVYSRTLPASPPGFAALIDARARGPIATRIRADGGRFRLYLATPGLFARGWLPAPFAAPQAGTPDMRLVSAAVEKPVPVSGWDLARRAPKPLRRAAPAGSVYFGQLSDPAQAEALVETFHFTTRLQAMDDLEEAEFLSAAGFGLTLVGAWTAASPIFEQGKRKTAGPTP